MYDELADQARLRIYELWNLSYGCVILIIIYIIQLSWFQLEMYIDEV